MTLFDLESIFQAWTGNYNVDFAHQGKPKPVPAEPVVIPPRKIIPPGRWVNCQPIRIDEGILDHQRITHLDLPQISLTTEVGFQNVAFEARILLAQGISPIFGVNFLSLFLVYENDVANPMI